ncbi:unnamed protein product [Leptidea sinapis]|uniref:LIM and SH3 domain protein Lasp n=1 Tax=Leptidea sinapis TaxID=189913 RepID=A0A5E4Q2I1_9NEOP|nr:unnamed protein product [Leptidea sinapis]
MNKTCARCEKTVYPTEELKCLDKVWHKGCFKCQECGMTLNMRTYKGYGKLPYCESHVPKAKHTTMAETPELKRIAENTKIQSNVKYHADFEKSKGKFTQVADDPETLRIKANTKIISNVAYHGDLEKKAQMERLRQINENGEIVEIASNDNYQHQIDSYATEMLNAPNLPPKNHYQTPAQQNRQYQEIRQEEYYPKPEEFASQSNCPPPSQYANQPQNYNQTHANQNQTYVAQTQSYANQNHTYAAQNQNYANQAPNHASQNQHYSSHSQVYQSQVHPNQNYGNQKIGRIQDYDPLSDGPRAVPNTQRASSTLIYNSSNDKRGGHQPQQQQTRYIGRVTDMDPLAGELVPNNAGKPRPNNHANQTVYIAMYDYEANDSDEVSFREGDLISNVTSIDEGWMTGQVLRTGRTGMLPANYVELSPDYSN